MGITAMILGILGAGMALTLYWDGRIDSSTYWFNFGYCRCNTEKEKPLAYRDGHCWNCIKYGSDCIRDFLDFHFGNGGSRNEC